MIEMRGKAYTEDDLPRYFGDTSCVAGMRRYELREGRARGCCITEVRTGAGLSFEVNETRGMDLGRMAFRGVPISYCSYNGEVHPAYYETFNDGWLRSFAGGLLVTGGLTAMGAPGVDGDEVLPLHGRISNIPAERVCCTENRAADGAVEYRVSGVVRESKALSCNLALRRTVRARQGENRLFIEDEIVNEGFEDSPLMLLYHFNIGHPVLDEGSRLFVHSAKVEPRDADAAAQPEPHDAYLAPTPHYKDIVYYHDVKPDAGGRATAAIVNERAGLGVYLAWSKDELDCFTQWKFLGEGNYVAGMEPGNAYVGGRAAEREAGRLKTLAARSSKRVHIEVGLLASADEIGAYRKENGF